MLVISQGLVLSPAEAAAANAPMFLWDDRVTITNVTADSEEVNYPATNLANHSTNQEWRAASATDVEITLAVAAEVSSVGIARHNFGSAGISFSIGYYDEEDEWVELTAPQIPPNDEPLLAVFTLTLLAEVVIRLTEGDAAARAAVVKCGPVLRMPRGYDPAQEFTPPRFARKTDVVNGMSWAGDILGRIVKGRSVEGSVAKFTHLDPDWYRSTFDPFVAAAQGDTTFFFAWAPEDRPYEVAYLTLSDDPIPLTSLITDRVGVSLKMGGILK